MVEPRISVFGVVRRLREQRYCMVQAGSQYEFIYEYILNWLVEKGLILMWSIETITIEEILNYYLKN